MYVGFRETTGIVLDPIACWSEVTGEGVNPRRVAPGEGHLTGAVTFGKRM